MKLKKLWLAIITITFTLMLSAMCSAAVIASGNCGALGDGSNVTYELTENGGTNYAGKPTYTLTLSGTGPMADYSYETEPWSSYVEQITSLSIGQGITKIGNHAFENFCFITELVIPNSVTEIGEYAFYCCCKVPELIIPDSVQTIGAGAFGDFYDIHSLTIPGNIKALEYEVFIDAYSLQSVVISSGVTKIGTSAFDGCFELQSIIIPNSVTTICNNAFSNCRALKNIAIPASVTTMETNIFQYNDAITNITHYVYDDGSSAPLPANIPENVTVKEIIVVKDNSLSLEMKVPSSAFGGDDVSSKYLEAASLIVNEKEYPLENCYIENNETFIFPIELKGSSNLGITDVRAEVYAKASPDSTNTLYYATDPLTLKWA